MRRPVHPSTIVQWTVAIVVALGLMLAIRAVRDAAPPSDADFKIPGATSNEALEESLEQCQRTLPEEPVLPDTDDVRTFGRVSSTAVYECPDLFDGHQVTYLGEVVGDILERDGGAWLLVNDDDYAVEVGPAATSGQMRGQNSGLAVWLPDPLVDELSRPGGPGWRGDVIEISGTVHRVDPNDGGGLTLRADDMNVVAEATPAETPINPTQAGLAIALVAVVLVLAVVERRAAANR